MTAPLADRDLQLLDRYVDGALEGPALDALRTRLAAEPALRDFTAGRHKKVQRGFYTSQAYEWVRR
jgi:hypothetical protein